MTYIARRALYVALVFLAFLPVVGCGPNGPLYLGLGVTDEGDMGAITLKDAQIVDSVTSASGEVVDADSGDHFVILTLVGELINGDWGEIQEFSLYRDLRSGGAAFVPLDTELTSAVNGRDVFGIRSTRTETVKLLYRVPYSTKSIDDLTFEVLFTAGGTFPWDLGFRPE